jgi:hypothetical protein
MPACPKKRKTENQIMNGYRNTQETSQKYEGCSLLTVESNFSIPTSACRSITEKVDY